jgi:putative flippase GtrA
VIVETSDVLPGDMRVTALAGSTDIAAPRDAVPCVPDGRVYQAGNAAGMHRLADLRWRSLPQIDGSSRPIGIVERGIRFVLVGGSSAVVQLSLLALFLRLGWQPTPADAVAVVVATELNFLLSSFVTWQDRWTSGGWSVRWLLFHASTGSMMLVNLLVFLGAHLALEPLLASAAGIVVAGTGNFVLANRVVFRRVMATELPTPPSIS